MNLSTKIPFLQEDVLSSFPTAYNGGATRAQQIALPAQWESVVLPEPAGHLLPRGVAPVGFPHGHLH